MDNSQSENKSFSHWSQHDDLLYHFFLVLRNQEWATNKIKASGFYVKMSKFVPGKSKVQCRSHHQKKLKFIQKKTNQADKKSLELLNIKNFYKTYYSDRLLDTAQLLKELRHHLKQKIQHQVQAKLKKTYQEYFLRAENIIQDLNFQQKVEQRQHQPYHQHPIDFDILNNILVYDDSGTHTQVLRLKNQAEMRDIFHEAQDFPQYNSDDSFYQ